MLVASFVATLRYACAYGVSVYLCSNHMVCELQTSHSEPRLHQQCMVDAIDAGAQ
jgi:hypothetical protein